MDLASLDADLLALPITTAGDVRLCRSTNKALTNRDVYVFSFKHLPQDNRVLKIWKGAAPLKSKIFLWLAHKKRLPTNE
jgi:hypothetical protein